MTWKTIRTWWARIGGVLMVVFFGWGFLAVQDWGVDPAVLTSNGNVTVETTDAEIRFVPGRPRAAGLIFFQGALVDPEAYAPFLRSVAEAGYPAFLVKLPLRGFSTEAAAVEAGVRARAILQEEGAEQRRWIVGGHSKGGLFASRIAAAHPQQIDRLLLIGTAHPREIDLSGSDLAVTKIVATRDGIATPRRVRAAEHNL